MFAHDLRRGSKSDAIAYLASMKADYDYTTLHGPDDAHEVGASNYLSSPPHLATIYRQNSRMNAHVCSAYSADGGVLKVMWLVR